MSDVKCVRLKEVGYKTHLRGLVWVIVDVWSVGHGGCFSKFV